MTYDVVAQMQEWARLIETRQVSTREDVENLPDYAKRAVERRDGLPAGSLDGPHERAGR